MGALAQATVRCGKGMAYVTNAMRAGACQRGGCKSMEELTWDNGMETSLREGPVLRVFRIIGPFDLGWEILLVIVGVRKALLRILALSARGRRLHLFSHCQ